MTRKGSMGILLTVLVVLICGGFVWGVTVYKGPGRQFQAAYDGYRAVPHPDAGKLSEWDRQLNEAYQTIKEAVTAGDKATAKSHLKPLNEIIATQDEFFRAQGAAQKKAAGLLPDLRTKATALNGQEQVVATRLVAREQELLKLGQDLNDGSLREMNLWRELSNNVANYLNAEIDGTAYLAQEQQIGQRLVTLKKDQEKSGLAAQGLIAKINADWKALRPLL